MSLNEGKIIINNEKIHYKMDSERFIKIFSNEVNSYVNGEIERYNFKNPQRLSGELLWVRVVFKNKYISSIELRNADIKLKNCYDNWSEDRVELIRKSHDKWLMNQLGQPDEIKQTGIKYTYAWGEIMSYYDFKGGDSGIIINYSK